METRLTPEQMEAEEAAATGETSRSEQEKAEGTTWVVLVCEEAKSQDETGIAAVQWFERRKRLTGTRREAEKDALALASAEQGIVVVPESSWKPKVAEPPREPRIADFDPWAGA